jgi:hypothetical protein
MMQPATVNNDSAQVMKTEHIAQIPEEKIKWSFEYLQRLNKGPFTAALWDHFRQWSLSQIPEDQKIMTDAEKEKLGKSFIAYSFRIYRIALKGMGEKKKRIHEACLLIGKGFAKLRGISDHQYRKEARCWLDDIESKKDMDNSAVKKLARQFRDTDYFETGLKIAYNNNPEILREYIITSDIPSNRMPDYPLQFLLFALNYFLDQTKYYNPNMSKYKLLSGLLSEQSIKPIMSDETIKDALQGQRKDDLFLEGLQSFYKRCQKAYFLPFVECGNLEGFDGFKKTRVLVETPDRIKIELCYLYPEWEEVFANNSISAD